MEFSSKESYEQAVNELDNKLKDLGISSIVVNDRAFKAQLDIGEDAYRILRFKNRLMNLSSAGGFATVGGILCSSTIVAETFFPTAGLLGFFGLGTAVTPIGWVLGAAVLAGGSWLLINKKSNQLSSKLVEKIPKFINSGIDVLGASLLSINMPLAIKVAKIDGELHSKEEEKIKSYFVKTWGYEVSLIDFVFEYYSNESIDFEVNKLVNTLAIVTKEHQDCNFNSIKKKTIKFLTHLCEVDGIIHDQELLAIKEIEQIFNSQ